MLQTAGRASYPTSPLAIISIFSRLVSILLSVVACCVYNLPQDSMVNDEFISIFHHLSPKSCASAIPSVSFVFVTPKVSSISNDPFTLISTWVGFVHLISYRGGVGCGSGCMSSCFGLLHGPSARALTHLSWCEERGEAICIFVLVLVRD